MFTAIGILILALLGTVGAWWGKARMARRGDTRRAGRLHRVGDDAAGGVRGVEDVTYRD